MAEQPQPLLPWPRVLDFLPLRSLLGCAQAASLELRAAGRAPFLGQRAGPIDVSRFSLTETQLRALLRDCPSACSLSCGTWYPAVSEYLPRDLLLLELRNAGLAELPGPLLHSCRKLRRLDLSGNRLLGERELIALSEAALPELRELSICHWRSFTGREAAVSAFNALLRSLPDSATVSAAGIPLLARYVQKDGPLRARVNLIHVDKLNTGPGFLCLRCGLCAAVLLPSVKRYVKGPPTQPHIQFELFFDEAPGPGRMAPVEGDSRRLNCAANCHSPRFLLAGPGSGIDTRGFAWAAACGPGLVFVESMCSF